MADYEIVRLECPLIWDPEMMHDNKFKKKNVMGVKNIHLALSLTMIINGLLEIGILHFV
jgi:hypothetical protein